MRINHLTLHNYRCYPTLHVDFNPDITVLLGRNGQGKTAVLDALAVAVGPFLGALDNATGSHFSNQDARRIPHKRENGRTDMETRYPLSLAAEGSVSGKTVTWQRYKNSAKGRTTIKESARLIHKGKTLQEAVRSGKEITLPLLAYYGTGRLWKEKRLTEKKQTTGAGSRLSGYTDCMNPESSYRAFTDWLRLETMIEYEQHLQAIEKGEPVTALTQGKLLQAIQKAVNAVMTPSRWKNIRFSPSAQEVVAEHPEHGILPVSSLSDGIRNMIGLLADIAYRAVRLNPHLEENAVIHTPGMVLIDEVDMHLHPEWQQMVLQDLTRAFPGIQFIVTTHSPQIISTVKKDHIRILELENDTASVPLSRTYGETSNDILETVMHTGFRPDLEHLRDLDRYLQMIDQNRFHEAEAKKLRQKLEKEIGTHHKDLQRADRIIRRKETIG